MRSTWWEGFWIALLIGILLGIQGCGATAGLGGNGAAGSTRLIAGTLPAAALAGSDPRLIVRNRAGDTVVPVAADGRFSISVAPGVYSLLLSTASGTSWVKKELLVDNDVTINVLDVQLTPIPTVVSVRVPMTAATSAIIEWETDLDSEGRVDYGYNTAYGYSTYTDTELKRVHRLQIHELTPATRYHFRVVSSRRGLPDTVTLSANYEFVTPAAD